MTEGVDGITACPLEPSVLQREMINSTKDDSPRCITAVR